MYFSLVEEIVCYFLGNSTASRKRLRIEEDDKENEVSDIQRAISDPKRHATTYKGLVARARTGVHPVLIYKFNNHTLNQ